MTAPVRLTRVWPALTRISAPQQIGGGKRPARTSTRFGGAWVTRSIEHTSKGFQGLVVDPAAAINHRRLDHAAIEGFIELGNANRYQLRCLFWRDGKWLRLVFVWRHVCTRV
jgi:hypothetical protein